jgi:hypothetical protein
MIKIGEAELHINNYVSIHAALKSFEEIVDAYCALSDLHFHEDPSTGWKKRIVWMIEKSLLYEEWEKIFELIYLFFKNNNDKYVKEIISIIKKNINNLEIYYNENKK